jgi:hypothetical protein
MTPLDHAHAEMQADPDDERAALRFYRLLTDTPLLLLLDREPVAENIEPRVFDLETGPVLLAFDSADRMAALADGPLAYAELPGRVIVAQMAGQGVGLGLNFGSDAPSETLLPPEAVEWLAQMVAAPALEEVQAVPQGFFVPRNLPGALMDALTLTVAAAPGLARVAYLVGVRYGDGRVGHMLAILDAYPEARAPLAQAVAQAIGFSGLEAAEIDVTFLDGADPAVRGIAGAGVMFEFPPERVAASAAVPAAPGSDPDKPPRLR